LVGTAFIYLTLQNIIIARQVRVSDIANSHLFLNIYILIESLNKMDFRRSICTGVFVMIITEERVKASTRRNAVELNFVWIML